MQNVDDKPVISGLR